MINPQVGMKIINGKIVIKAIDDPIYAARRRALKLLRKANPWIVHNRYMYGWIREYMLKNTNHDDIKPLVLQYDSIINMAYRINLVSMDYTYRYIHILRSNTNAINDAIRKIKNGIKCAKTIDPSKVDEICEVVIRKHGVAICRYDYEYLIDFIMEYINELPDIKLDDEYGESIFPMDTHKFAIDDNFVMFKYDKDALSEEDAKRIIQARMRKRILKHNKKIAKVVSEYNETASKLKVLEADDCSNDILNACLYNAVCVTTELKIEFINDNAFGMHSSDDLYEPPIISISNTQSKEYYSGLEEDE